MDGALASGQLTVCTNFSSFDFNHTLSLPSTNGLFFATGAISLTFISDTGVLYYINPPSPKYDIGISFNNLKEKKVVK